SGSRDSEVRLAVTVHVRIARVGLVEGGLHHRQVLEVDRARRVEVGIADVTDAAVVPVTLIGVRGSDAVVCTIDDAILIRVAHDGGNGAHKIRNRRAGATWS